MIDWADTKNGKYVRSELKKELGAALKEAALNLLLCDSYCQLKNNYHKALGIAETGIILNLWDIKAVKYVERQYAWGMITCLEQS